MRISESSPLLLSVLKMAVEKGADVNAANYQGNTPLHEAALRGSFVCASFLLSNNAKIDVVNTYVPHDPWDRAKGHCQSSRSSYLSASLSLSLPLTLARSCLTTLDAWTLFAMSPRFVIRCSMLYLVVCHLATTTLMMTVMMTTDLERQLCTMQFGMMAMMMVVVVTA